MSTWAERFKGHLIWEALPALGRAIDEALRRDELEPEQIDELERARAVLALVGKRLAACDPYLLCHSTLDGVLDSVANVGMSIGSFGSSGERSQLTNASTQVDDMLRQSQLLVAPTAEELGGLAQAAASYRQDMANEFAKVRTEREKLNAEVNGTRGNLATLSTAVDAETKRVATFVADWEGKLSAAQEARQKRSDDQINAFQEQFSTAQETRNQVHSESQSKRQERFDSLLADYTTKLTEQNSDFTRSLTALGTNKENALEELQKEYVDRAGKILIEVAGQKDQVDKMLEVIGERGVTVGHNKTADDARGKTSLWQGVTVVALIVLIVIAAITVFHSDKLSLGAFAGRVYISVALGVLAAYAASQADRYHGVERHNRKLALELAALGPFIQPLPEQEREKFRITIGERTFAQAEPQTGKSGSPATAAHVLLKSKEFKVVLELLKTFVDKEK